jgi:hypothetical protein
MGWNLEGMLVWGRYLDEVDVVGRCELSRVAYGGDVKHTLVLNEPITIYGRVADRVILDNKQVTKVAEFHPLKEEKV